MGVFGPDFTLNRPKLAINDFRWLQRKNLRRFPFCASKSCQPLFCFLLVPFCFPFLSEPQNRGYSFTSELAAAAGCDRIGKAVANTVKHVKEKNVFNSKMKKRRWLQYEDGSFEPRDPYEDLRVRRKEGSDPDFWEVEKPSDWLPDGHNYRKPQKKAKTAGA